ncbi:hypothetical protein LVD15_25085 [Fulvivirga maritima]|uniref:hypothetical protein n=1 Tax=Fulvivirga maritima TaxID=2904247 RepID=UPI001F3DCE89|nr:hypothetical protein [Fulvivirga maritima]UII26532.1 hypothetical protein LVD15_25085 [Fulvivirga maritima]
MHLTITPGNGPSLDLEFLMPVLIESLLKTDFNANNGSPIHPINLDQYLKNRPDTIFPIDRNITIEATLEGRPESKIEYGEVKNVSKNSKGYMKSLDWEKYFHLSNQTNSAPNGSLYVLPENEKLLKLCTVDYSTEDNLFISYGAVLSFVIEGCRYYGSIDPIAKISSSE